MAISTPFGRPILSLNAKSSPSLCFFKTHHHNLLMTGYHNSYRPFVINCSTSEMGPASDHMNLRHNPNACILDTLTYHELTSRELSVMDLTAITLCQENNIPVVVFNLGKPGNISKAIRGERVGTLIGGAQNSVAATN